MIKAIVIEDCSKCPHNPDIVCIKADLKPIPEDNKIPDWCPLEDVKDVAERYFDIDRE